jgi:DNA uptake protein ComE-like DNA-binding protein
MEDHPVRRMTQTLSFLVGACICLALAAGFMTQTLSGSGGVAAYEGERINPNEAPVASLTRLPGVGLTRARTIVAYRDEVPGPAGPRPGQVGQGPAFAKPEDLRRIRGIGPGVVEDVRPWLQFEMSSVDTTTDLPR